jgi:hypothetical protein
VCSFNNLYFANMRWTLGSLFMKHDEFSPLPIMSFTNVICFHYAFLELKNCIGKHLKKLHDFLQALMKEHRVVSMQV